MAMTPEESYAAALGQEPTPAEYEAAGQVTPQEVAPVDQTAPAAAPTEPEAPRSNPSWDAAWENVPDPIREAQRTHFQKWDANFNALQAKYRPYEEIERRGYNPEYITTAIDIQQALIEDPQGFVERVAEQFGLTLGQAAQVAQNAAQQQQEEQFLTPEEQRIRALEERQRQIDENFQRRLEAEQRQQEEARYVQQITGALQNLHTKYGAFDEDRVVQWAAANAQRGGNPDLEVALNEILAWEADVIQRHAKTAPSLLGSSTAIAPPASAPEPRKVATSDELLQRALQLGPQLLGGN